MKHEKRTKNGGKSQHADSFDSFFVVRSSQISCLLPFPSYRTLSLHNGFVSAARKGVAPAFMHLRVPWLQPAAERLDFAGERCAFRSAPARGCLLSLARAIEDCSRLTMARQSHQYANPLQADCDTIALACVQGAARFNELLAGANFQDRR